VKAPLLKRSRNGIAFKAPKGTVKGVDEFPIFRLEIPISVLYMFFVFNGDRRQCPSNATARTDR
jgi:hypothetical protein